MSERCKVMEDMMENCDRDYGGGHDRSRNEGCTVI
ncbi:hypothetical protein X470_01216, partial [Bartonella bacilliformis Peru-18]